MKNNIELRKEIQEQISKTHSAQDIFNIFKLLKYPDRILFDPSSKRKKDTFDFKQEDKQKVKEIYSILSFEEKLPVFLLETTTLSSSFIRSITTTFDKQYLQFMLIFSTDYSEILFVMPTREKIETGKYKLKLTKLSINKNEIHYTDVQTLASLIYEEEHNWRDIWKKWRETFNVKRVTKDFFEDYKNIFFTLRDELIKQKMSRIESHEFTLQLLNRIMFIYFVSKKKWLEYTKFINWLWNSYKKLGKYNSNEFYEKWLNQVFFKAFNNRSNEVSGLPKEVKDILSNVPYLNGGLFRKNDLDDLKIKITDKMFNGIFEFFEKYNFTIKEDMPLEQEVAVDPQMIGYVYESLANVAEEIYDRNDLGIYFTERTEVDFMCRRSILEYLSKHLSSISKDGIYHLVFDTPEEKEKIEKYIDNEKTWHQLEDVLDNLSAVDPACGSGAFLVGLLNVLTEIYKIVYSHIKRDLTDFELKNKIIQYSLYGVDVMPWAIHTAELRLWLQLIVETEFKKGELKKHPLLPNLNLNLRVGDSLVQEIGGISFNIRDNDLDEVLKKKLDNLKQEKRKYFENSPTAKFKTPEEVVNEEIRLFEEIINQRIEYLKHEIKILTNNLKVFGKQTTLSGETNLETEIHLKEKEIITKREKTIEQHYDEIKNLNKIKHHISDPEKKPFVWDIDFAEIFSDKNGFDIVIGNPPYVKEGMISPPNKIKSEVTTANRLEYKQKLIKSVQTQFSVMNSISKMSDYYLYFYFHGLGLLNQKGTLCFISSNSWLDVNYGKSLQEFLLKYVSIIAIYDSPKRSFEHADVNTIIALLGAPKFHEESIAGFRVMGGTEWLMLNHTAKFIMFKKSLEEILSTKTLIDIETIKIGKTSGSLAESVKNVVNTNDYRVFPVMQESLLEEGWEYPENYDEKKGQFKKGMYVENKWGSKYLRAPDIFYTILQKGKSKFVELNTIAEILPGCYSGINDFFYLNEELIKKYGIEKSYLKPLIRNSDVVTMLLVKNTKGNFVLSIPSLSKQEIKSKSSTVLAYIEWGEKQVTRKRQKTEAGIPWPKVESVKNRKFWYTIPEQNLLPTTLFMQYVANDRCYCPYSNISFVSDRSFHRIFPKKEINSKVLAASLNSSLQIFLIMIFGRSNLGEGALKFEASDAKRTITFDIRTLTTDKLESLIAKLESLGNRKPLSVFEELGIEASKPIREQEPKPIHDRAALDKIIFDEIGLTAIERNEVYWGICELVKQRLEKARSLEKD